MKLVARRLAWLLPVVLCACAHNPIQTQMQAMAPPLDDVPPPPDISPTALPAPKLDIPKTPAPVAVPPEPVKTTPRHHRTVIKAAGGATTPPANGTSGQSGQSGQVAEAPPTEVSAAGQFGPPEPADQKKQTENSINDIERGVNGIGRKLNDQEAKTIVQIREFLKQARTDLATGDVVAAQTLATKAKALLGELSE